MNIKKRVYLFIILLISMVLFHFSIVAAQGFEGLSRGMSEGIKLILGDFTGATLNEIFFIKLLVFFLLFAIIFTVMKKIPNFGDNRGLVLIISIVVSLIAVRYMTTESIINFIWLPYGTLGVVLSVLLPFIIGFYFIEGFDSSVIRKVGWVTFIVIFIGLAYMRWPDFATGGEWWQNLAWMYLAIGILSFLLLLVDKQIHTFMFLSSLRGVEDVNKRVEAARISAEIEKNRQLLAQTTDHKAIAAINKKIAEQNKTLRAILRS